MNIQLKYALFLLIIAFTACSKKGTFQHISTTEQITLRSDKTAEKREKCDCLSTEHYEVKEEFAVLQDLKYVNTLYIFTNSSDLKNNWVGEDMIYYAEALNRIGNRRLSENAKMKLPEGNNTPKLQIPWRYRMLEDENEDSGLAIYQVIDDELYYYVTRGKNRNNYDKKIIEKYGRDRDKALNIFAMSHHPDSIASPTYKPSRVGISLGTAVKISGVTQGELGDVWKMATLYNHEIGHSMGLRHSWYKNDGCDDTPAHPNCYSPKKEGKCKGPTSNNMMDYNHSQKALTPCQISIATKYLNNPKSKVRSAVYKDWCRYDVKKSLIVKKDMHLDRFADLKGDIVVNNGATLRISCQLSMPRGSKIIVSPGATLELNGCTILNDCGETWDGIELREAGKKKATVITMGNVKIENVALR